MNPAPPISFTERFRLVARERALLPNSIASYTFWIKLFYRFTCRGAATWTGRDWEGFERSLLAADPPYSYAARRQARCALAFAFSRVLGKDVGRLDLPIIPKPERKLPVVPTRAELGLVFAQLRGVDRLQALLMYGSGPRVEEVCRLRVQDVDFTRATLRIWDGKGAKNRLTVLPVGLIPELRRHVAQRALLHEQDLAEGGGVVELPGRFARKARGAERTLGWQWLFPSSRVHGPVRFYRAPDSVGKAVRLAVRRARIAKAISPHSFRRAFATDLERAGAKVTTIQRLLGHANVETTLLYLHIDEAEAFSPLDVPTAALVPAWSIERREVLALAAAA